MLTVNPERKQRKKIIFVKTFTSGYFESICHISSKKSGYVNF